MGRRSNRWVRCASHQLTAFDPSGILRAGAAVLRTAGLGRTGLTRLTGLGTATSRRGYRKREVGRPMGQGKAARRRFHVNGDGGNDGLGGWSWGEAGQDAPRTSRLDWPKPAVTSNSLLRDNPGAGAARSRVLKNPARRQAVAAPAPGSEPGWPDEPLSPASRREAMKAAVGQTHGPGGTASR